jgi:hypothetical protein
MDRENVKIERRALFRRILIEAEIGGISGFSASRAGMASPDIETQILWP